MTGEPRSEFYGDTPSLYLSRVPYELRDMGGALWKILGAGRYDFRFKGTELDDFIRRGLIRLIEHGGRPMVFDEAAKQWRIETRYGRTPREIADAVIAEWHAQGSPDLTWGEGPWFRSKDSE